MRYKAVTGFLLSRYRVQRYFDINDEDWEIMTSQRRRSYTKQFKLERVAYIHSLKELGLSNKSAIITASIRYDLGYLFDPFGSNGRRLYFVKNERYIMFDSWKEVERWAYIQRNKRFAEEGVNVDTTDGKD